MRAACRVARIRRRARRRRATRAAFDLLLGVDVKKEKIADVIDLDARRPHVVRYVKCMGCGHQWHASLPPRSDVLHLECSVCHVADSALIAVVPK